MTVGVYGIYSLADGSFITIEYKKVPRGTPIPVMKTEELTLSLP